MNTDLVTSLNMNHFELDFKPECFLLVFYSWAVQYALVVCGD